MKKKRNVISDVIAILKESIDPLACRRKLKERMKKKMKPWQTVTGWKGKLQMENADDRFSDTEQLVRLIQSIPYPKAEPFKQWLVKTGYERMKEIADPEQSLVRA